MSYVLFMDCILKALALPSDLILNITKNTNRYVDPFSLALYFTMDDDTLKKKQCFSVGIENWERKCK